MADFIPYAELAPEQKEMVDSFFTYRRVKAAERGLGLDKLVADKTPAVRLEVAEHEYGLDKLFKDPDPLVAEAAERCLGVLTIEEWIDQNPDRCEIFWNRRPIWTPEQLEELKAREKEHLRIVTQIDESYDPAPAHPSNTVPAHPTYTAEELIAMLSEHPDVVHASIWTHDDVAAEVERLGYDPFDTEFMEAVCDDFAEALDDQEEAITCIENIVEYHAPSDCEIGQDKSFTVETQRSQKPQGINPKDDLAKARAATSPCMRNHVQNPSRYQGR